MQGLWGSGCGGDPKAGSQGQEVCRTLEAGVRLLWGQQWGLEAEGLGMGMDMRRGVLGRGLVAAIGDTDPRPGRLSGEDHPREEPSGRPSC